MPSLLIVSVGPVQDFIAASRRCHDHWFGSWLLSQVTQAAVEAIQPKYGHGCVVFPKATGNDGCGANKIVAIVEDPTGAARDADAAVRARAIGLLHDVLQGCSVEARSGIDAARALLQVAELNEVLWAAVPVTTGYGDARDRAEALLAARKNTRTWRPPNWHGSASHVDSAAHHLLHEVLDPDVLGPWHGWHDLWFGDSSWMLRADTRGVPKSSLDGMRESVLMAPPKANASSDDRRAWTTLSEWLRLRKGETLCGVGVLKRRGAMDSCGEHPGDRPPVHSTSHVAAAPLLARLANDAPDADAARSALSRYIAYLRTLRIRDADFEIRSGWKRSTSNYDSPLARGRRIEAPRVFPLPRREREGPPRGGVARGADGAIFFEGRVLEMLDERADAEGEPRQRPPELRNELLRCLEAFGVHGDQPHPYYALLLADGDHMGRAIDRRNTREDHERISSELDEFAKQTSSTVEAFGGSLIYSGGDDVLALVPLHTVLQCARELHDTFENRIGRMRVPGGSDEFMFPGDDPPSLSVGVAILHHIEDMSTAHQKAREAERLAKEGLPATDGVQAVKGRDALAIILSKRGGADLRFFAKWSERPDDRLLKWCSVLHEDAVPDKLPYEIEAALEPLAPGLPPLVEGPERATPDLAKVVGSLVRRVAARRRGSRGDENMDECVAAIVNARATSIASARALAEEIQIARELLAAMHDAFGRFVRAPEPAGAAAADPADGRTV